MAPARLRAVLVACLVLAGAAGAALLVLDDGPRADLAGAEQRATTTTTTTTAPPEPATTTTSATTTSLPEPADPRRLVIPDLGVDTSVVPVGLEPDGAMEVPGATEAGWYLHGVRPGSSRGSSVVAAHVDYGGRRGVFFDLRTLGIGAEVIAVDATGREHRYVVSERFQVDKDALPIPELFRTSGDPVLTLITCGGIFDGGERSYRDNIVVRATPR